MASDLSKLAMQLNLLENYREDATVLKVSAEDDTGDIDEDTQKYTPFVLPQTFALT